MDASRLVVALGWALVHSFWMLALVGLAAALLMRWAGAGRPGLQHALAWAALLLCLALPMAVFIHRLGGAWEGGLAQGVATAVPAVQGAAPLPVASSWGDRGRELLLSAFPWITGAWALGSALMALRLAGGWRTARRWRREAGAPPPAWAARLRSLGFRMGLRADVELKVTPRLATPAALGVWRPVVLLPAACLAGLPEAYLEALLAHELAHVLRHDYLFNLLQSVLEVLLFHHPTVWWLSRRIRSLREHLADDLAARALGEPRRLALALDALDDLAAVRPLTPHLAVTALGGTLFDRVQHLLHPAQPAARPGWLPATLLVLLLPCAALCLKAAMPSPAIPGEPALVAELDALAAKEGLDPQLLRAVAWAESGLARQARSPMGALGVLQVLPETARACGATDLADPAQVMAAGARHLRSLLDRYQGDVSKALAAYNGGVEAADAGRLGEETRAYVPLVLDLWRARAVQPEHPLGAGCAEGVLRRLADGSWMLAARFSVQGNLDFDVVEDGPGGAVLCHFRAGSAPGEAPAATWPESRPKIRFHAKEGVPVLLRCRSGQARGEARLVLDGTWKTFAFAMKS